MSDYISDIRQGNTKTIKIDYGKGVNIAGWVFYFILKTDIDDESQTLQITQTAGDDPRDDTSNGLAFFVIPSTITADIESGRYYWSLQVNKGGIPALVDTILPPLDDYRDRVAVINKMDIT